MQIDCIIGIDPGKAGGIAYFRPNHPTKAMKMPAELTDLVDWFDYMKEISNPIVFVEKVQLRPDDIVGNPGKAFRIQKMLADFEKLKTIMTVVDIPFVLVNPMKWQSGLKLRVKGEEKPARKHRYQQIAQRLYPEIRTTLWNSDALLIMHFGRKMLNEDEKWILQNLPEKLHDKLF